MLTSQCRPGHCSHGQGVAMQGCMDTVLPYVRERSQFGKPIGSFQLIQAKLADMYVAIEASRSLSYRTALALDRNELLPKDCAAAILHAAEHATQCALQAIQVRILALVQSHLCLSSSSKQVICW